MSDSKAMVDTLGERMSRAAADVAYIMKGGFNEAQNYAFLGEAQVKAKVNEALRKHGLYISCAQHHLIAASLDFDAGGKPRAFAQVQVRITIEKVDGGPDDQTADAAGIGFGFDKGGSADKSVYKAQAGALKYALTSLFLIATGDEAETTSSADKEDKSPSVDTKPKTAPKAAPQTESTNAALTAQNLMAAATTAEALDALVGALAQLREKMSVADYATIKENFKARKAQLTPKKD